MIKISVVDPKTSQELSATETDLDIPPEADYEVYIDGEKVYPPGAALLCQYIAYAQSECEAGKVPLSLAGWLQK